MASEFRIKTVANLTTPTTVPPEETCRYGICFSFQVSPDTAGLFCGVRGSRGYDFELGTDVILFREFADISAERAIAVSRNHEAVNPRSSPPGQPAIMVKYPIRGGFVPLGARLEDGSPHPGAGSGFGVSMSVAWTADQRKEYPEAEKYQYVEGREELEPPLPAWDCNVEYGPAPSKVAWIVDHPAAYTVRLGDGAWHNLLCTRICDMGEVSSGAGPTERSGTHLQEVESQGESRPTWSFQA